MKKIVCVIFTLMLPVLANAEAWAWKTKVKEIRTYGGGNGNRICFTVAASVGRPICFITSDAGASERYSLLMAAKVSGLPISVSYKTDQQIQIWFDNYKAWHIILED